MNMEKLLSVKNITKEFSGTRAVDNVSFDVYKGEILGILGPNGAGKTTTIRCIMNILYPDSGEISFALHNNKKSVSSRIGYLPEERGLYKTVRVMDILLYLSGLKGYPKEKAKKRIYGYLEKFNLEGKENLKIEELSKGMAQKVQFIASVLHEPELLILDEPFSGLDPVSQDVFKEEIKALASSGTSILLSSHQMNLVEALCDRIFLINKGKKVIYGNLDEVKEQYADFKCVIKGNNSEIIPGDIPYVKAIDRDGISTVLYLEKQVNPNDFLKIVADKVSFKELYIDRISLHDIFVNIATGG